MLMFITGVPNIRDVIPFARTPGSAEFYPSVIPSEVEESLAVCFVPPSALRLADPRKLEFRTAGLLQDHPIARNFQLINCRSERRFNFDAVLITELISAANITNQHRAIFRKFPNRSI